MTPEAAETVAEEKLANWRLRTAVGPAPAASPSAAPEVPTSALPAKGKSATVAVTLRPEQREEVIDRLIANGASREQAEEKITSYFRRMSIKDHATRADSNPASPTPALYAYATSVPANVDLSGDRAKPDLAAPRDPADMDDDTFSTLPALSREGRRHLLSIADIAGELGVVKITIVRWVENGLMPSPDYVVGTAPGAAWAWDPTSLEDWLVGVKKERTRS